MKKAKKCFVGILAAFIAVVMFLPTTPMKAEKMAAKTYTVTFRAGNVGRFQTGLSGISNTNIELTSNYIKFTVKKGESLSSSFDFISDDASLDAFFLNLTDDIDEGYRLKNVSNWCAGAAASAVNRNTEYVLDYAKLVNPVKYIISFVDAESGEQIAPPTIAYGNKGEEILCSPLSLTSYDTKDVAVTIVLDAEDEDANNVVFKYTYSGTSGTVIQTAAEYTEGDTVVEPVINEIVEEEPAAAAVAAPGGADAQQEELVEIEDEEVPLANEEQQEGTAEGDLVEIEDEEVPLAVESDQSTTGYWKALAGGAIVVIGAGAATMIIINKRKKVKA